MLTICPLPHWTHSTSPHTVQAHGRTLRGRGDGHTTGWPAHTGLAFRDLAAFSRQPCSAPPGRGDTSGACPADSSAAWVQGSASRGLRSGLGGAASPCFPQQGSGTCAFLPAVKHDAFFQTGRLESKSPLCFICDPAPTTHPQFWSWNYVRRLKF